MNGCAARQAKLREEKTEFVEANGNLIQSLTLKDKELMLSSISCEAELGVAKQLRALLVEARQQNVAASKEKLDTYTDSLKARSGNYFFCMYIFVTCLPCAVCVCLIWMVGVMELDMFVSKVITLLLCYGNY